MPIGWEPSSKLSQRTESRRLSGYPINLLKQKLCRFLIRASTAMNRQSSA